MYMYGAYSVYRVVMCIVIYSSNAHFSRFVRCQYVYKSTRVYTYLVGNVRDYYERNSNIKIRKCMEKEFGLKGY